MDDAAQVAGGLLVYDDGAHGAFFHALAALDARVLVHDGGGAADDVEHALGARINADTATGTLVSINLWSCHSLRFLPVSRALPYARLIAGLKITVTPCLRNRYFAGSILRRCCGLLRGRFSMAVNLQRGLWGRGRFSMVLIAAAVCYWSHGEPTPQYWTESRPRSIAAMTVSIVDGLCYQSHREPTPRQPTP